MAADDLVVIDASAVVPLLVRSDPISSEVARRIAGRRLIAPAHLPFEVANVLRRLGEQARMSPDQAETAFANLLQLPVDLWPWETVAARTWELRSNLSAYDAAYVALAEFVDAPLVTSDSRLARAPGIRCVVELV